MALFGSFTRADKLFADQFEPIGNGDFIYRLNQKGAAFLVRSWERDDFIESFIKARQRSSWALMLVIVVKALGSIFIFGTADTKAVDRYLYGSIAVTFAVFYLFWSWAWKAPARALAERIPEAPTLPKEVARQAALQRLSWGQFAWAALVLAIGAVRLATAVDVLSGWNRLWLAAGIAVVVMLGWRAWQKWKAENTPD